MKHDKMECQMQEHRVVLGSPQKTAIQGYGMLSLGPGYGLCPARERWCCRHESMKVRLRVR